jgi:hypothetical protein
MTMGTGMSPCTAAILEREQQERERREKERKERQELERIKSEKKEIERREQELKKREPYMCPGEANIEKTAIKEAKEVHLERQRQKDRKRATPRSAIVSTDPIGPAPETNYRDLELRGGVFHFGCDCTKRNGLQDNCQRIECLGRPPCRTEPPMCIPSGGIGYISPCIPDCEPPCYD